MANNKMNRDLIAETTGLSKWSEWAEYQEILRLIARYDWAVEDGAMPEDSKLTRAEAIILRTKLIGLLKEPYDADA